MEGTTIVCPKCSGRMERGFSPDFAYGSVAVGSWHEGTAKKSFWRRTRARIYEGIPMAAFRCGRCGYVELYSRAEFAAQ